MILTYVHIVEQLWPYTGLSYVAGDPSSSGQSFGYEKGELAECALIYYYR